MYTLLNIRSFNNPHHCTCKITYILSLRELQFCSVFWCRLILNRFPAPLHAFITNMILNYCFSLLLICCLADMHFDCVWHRKTVCICFFSYGVALFNNFLLNLLFVYSYFFLGFGEIYKVPKRNAELLYYMCATYFCITFAHLVCVIIIVLMWNIYVQYI